jgi:hypothetical protein
MLLAQRQVEIFFLSLAGNLVAPVVRVPSRLRARKRARMDEGVTRTRQPFRYSLPLAKYWCHDVFNRD